MSSSLLSIFIDAYRKESRKSGIIEGLCERLDDRDALDGAEGMLKALDVLNVQVHRNGFHGYLWNCEPVEWIRAGKALERIKDDVGSKLLKRASGVFFPVGPKSDPLAKRQQVDRLGQRQRGILDKADNDWYANRPNQEAQMMDFFVRNAALLKVIEKAKPTRMSLTWISASETDRQLFERFQEACGPCSFGNFGFQHEMLFSSARHLLCTSSHVMGIILVLPAHGAVVPQLLPMMAVMRQYLHLHLVVFGSGREGSEEGVTFLTSSDVSAITSAVKAVARVAE